MSTWTNTALQTLEGYLRHSRTRVVATGADPDEVTADLRRHVEQEVAALRLPVVTETDVRRIVRQIGPLPEDEVPTPPEAGLKRRSKLISSANSAGLVIFGMILPVVALIFEMSTRLCAGVFFDPLPSWLHVGFVLLVPAVNLAAWRTLLDSDRAVPRWLWLANGAASGVSLIYAIFFLPLSPFALVGILYFGMGLLPLAPLLALICTLQLRKQLKRRQLLREESVLRGWGWALSGPLLLLLVLALHAPVTRHWMVQASSDSPAEAQRAIRRLRTFGSHEVMLRECYGRANRLWMELFGGNQPNSESARNVYYRVAGKPFNSVPPPLSKHQPAGRAVLNEFEWDAGLGGDTVAGQVRGLSLAQSRMDGLCKADEGWAYVEWILEFQNDHERSQREARAQVQLPPGGVISRLTLWVNGEEREAAFAGRSQVREAYQKVAVVQQRDPVLVTMSGPDRVLVQCFPIPAGGGRMKLRLGITAPLVVESASQAALRLPCFIERNFGISQSLEHSFWLETPQQPATRLSKLVLDTHQTGKFGVHGQFSDAELSSPHSTLRFAISPKLATIQARDGKNEKPQLITQTLETAKANMPERLAIVLDGSAEMTEFFPEIAQTLAGLPSHPDMAIWLAQDGTSQVFRKDWKSGESAATVVGRLRGIGGQDDLPALLEAWEWAAAASHGAIIWIHGTQPMLLGSLEALKQRLEWRNGEGPSIIDVAVQPGPNRIGEALAKFDALTALPRLGELTDDLERLFATWSGRRPEFRFNRTAEPEIIAAGFGHGASPSASSHVVRLWACDQIHWLVKIRQMAKAIDLAGRYQLVTPVSGAVVLETAQQFKEAGLTPADPLTVPGVPEPRTWILVIVASFVLLFHRQAVPAWKSFMKHRP